MTKHPPEWSLPKLNRDAALSKGQQYFTYATHSFQTSSPEIYACKKKIGRGKYSEVFLATNLLNSQTCVVKILKQDFKTRIKREVKILQILRGENNCIKLFDIVKCEDITSLIFEYAPSVDYRTLVVTMPDESCQNYLYKILKGLEHCHSLGIMHRDIKPQNVMIDVINDSLKIIDWGMAEFYLPNNSYSVKVGSRFYKAPEILLNNKFYDYSLDMWSFGVMMAEMIFNNDIMFKGNDDWDQLHQIVKVLGYERLLSYTNDFELEVPEKVQGLLKNEKGFDLKSFVDNSNSKKATPVALDLIRRILQYDHSKRPTAKECMEHPYFEKIHNKKKE